VSAALDETHDPALESWVESANADGADFPIQNLPFGRFRERPGASWRIGVAIGDHVLDLRRTGLIDGDDMHELLTLGPAAHADLRRALSTGLARGSAGQSAWRDALRPIADVEPGVPCDIGDYTDFYAGIHHATAVGRLFRPDNPLLPNYKWVPIGYHGRASTVIASGQDFHRPQGQLKGAEFDLPIVAPSRRLDFELELGAIVARSNALGQPIALDEAESHVFGLVLLNDWSARDIQAWEYQPLGPFLSKSFATTISPWMVTLDALAPFRRPFVRAPGEPAPLPYLDSQRNRNAGAIDVDLDVLLQTATMRAAGTAPARISRSNFADAAYWTIAQLVTHHTVNGCRLVDGDLIGTGTLSGAAADAAGSLLELSAGGKSPIGLPNGEARTFLEDGDTVILRGRCRRGGFRSIGFGEARATVLPARG
jgi:fumarylacetoacetase